MGAVPTRTSRDAIKGWLANTWSKRYFATGVLRHVLGATPRLLGAPTVVSRQQQACMRTRVSAAHIKVLLEWFNSTQSCTQPWTDLGKATEQLAKQLTKSQTECKASFQESSDTTAAATCQTVFASNQSTC